MWYNNSMHVRHFVQQVGFNALMKAVAVKDVGIVKVLLSYGAEPDRSAKTELSVRNIFFCSYSFVVCAECCLFPDCIILRFLGSLFCVS